MPKGSLNVSLKGADDIFSTEESRQEQQREQVQQIPIGELFPFKNHPFKVLDDESMQRTVESVEQYGVLSPLIARPRPEGGYEIISGHRRQHAAQLAGLDALPVIVRNMDDDAAVLLMPVQLFVSVTRFIVQYRITKLLESALFYKLPAIRFHILTPFLVGKLVVLPPFRGAILPFEKNAEDFRIFFKKFFEQQNTPVRKARTDV